jgi:hypothetical protein
MQAAAQICNVHLPAAPAAGLLLLHHQPAMLACKDRQKQSKQKLLIC